MSEDTAPAPGLAAAEVPEPAAVTVVVPIAGDASHVRALLRRITESVPGRLPCEVLFVVDSGDDGVDVIREAAQDCPYPVAVLHRDDPAGGLGGAVAGGMRAAGSDWIVVMGGDPHRHPPSVIPELIATGECANAALVVASRPAGSGPRPAASRGAARLAKALFPRRLRGIGDPLSGFFAIRRSAVTAPAPRPLGPDVLLQLAVRGRPRRVAEVPFAVAEPGAGEPAPSVRAAFGFLRRLAGLRTTTPIARLLGFGLIGASGFVPNLAGLSALTALGLHYVVAEILANQLGVAWNFLLVEQLLFRDRRAHRRWWDRLGRFALLANADLLLRIPLIALLVGRFGMGALTATALALVLTFVVRFAGTEALVYLPRRNNPRRAV